MAYRSKAEFYSGKDSIPDVVKIEPNQALLDPAKTEGRRLRALLIDIVDTAFGALYRFTSNNQVGGDQHVTNLTARDAIKEELLVVGMRCTVTNNTTAAAALLGDDNGQAEYILSRDPAGALAGFIDAEYGTTTTVPVAWVRPSTTGAAVATRITFIDKDVLEINHGLAQPPAVRIYDTDGYEMTAQIQVVNSGVLEIQFNSPESGFIVY